MATILIVDDNQNIRQYLDTLLRRRGHHVLQGGSVRQALELCRSVRPDLIVTDVLMPESDGYEFVRQLRSEEPLAGVPVVFFTGSYYQESDAHTFAEACGVALVISKLAKPDAILDAIETVLAASAVQPPKPLHPEFDREHTRVLTDKLYANVRELEDANANLRASGQQLQRLAERLRSAQEDERTRIARHLHDELGQALTLLRMNCAWIAAHLPETVHPGVTERLQTSLQVAGETIHTVRRLATELRPGILDLGIAAAIEWQAEEFGRRTEIPCLVDFCEESESIEPGVATELFRIFQETLTNVVRHAHATEVHVTLKRLESEMVLEVRDDGIGITTDQIADRSALGLLGMSERTSLIGGKLSIEGNPLTGTTIRVHAPLRGTQAGTAISATSSERTKE